MEDLTAIMKERDRRNPFTAYNHIEMVSLTPEEAVFRLEIRPESKNAYGMVHGGAIYAMADNAAGFVVHTDGRHHVTQTSAMHFLRNQAEGVVMATARIRHRGNTTSLVMVDITGAEGKLIATGEFHFFCVDKTVLDRKVHP